VAAAYAWWCAWRVYPRLRDGAGDVRAELRRLLGFGGWYTVANAGVLLAGWSDRYVLGAFFAPRAVGFYSLAQQMQLVMSSLFTEASEVLFPAVSHRHGMGEESAARRLSLLAGWTSTSVFGPVAVSVALVGGDFLWLWISPEAAHEATVVLRLLCASSVVALAVVAPVFFALGTGRAYWQAPFSLTAGVAALVVSLLLVPSLGLRAVGIGVLTGAIVRWALFIPLWRTLFREDVRGRDFLLQVCAPPLASLALLGALLPIHDALPHWRSWPALLLEAVVAFAVASALQFAIGEALPGGPGRRRDVVSSFRPVAERAWRLLRGTEQR
jgi:teichuronic acid exporter